MKMDLTKQPKWVQKHIEGLESKLDLARELLVSAPQKTTHNSDYAKCKHWKIYNKGCSGEFGECDCGGDL